MRNNSKEVLLEFDLPGFAKKDIQVSANKNSIKVKAEKRSHVKKQRKDFFHEERVYSSFAYATTTPDINPKKVKTKFSKGKLEIIAPKA